MLLLAFFIIFFNSSASKYLSQNPNIFFLFEVMLVCLGQSRQVRKSIKKFENILVIKALWQSWVDYSLWLCWEIEGCILCQINQTASKSEYYLWYYDKFSSDLKNSTIKNPSCIFRPLVKYLGSDNRRVWALALQIWNLKRGVTWKEQQMVQPLKTHLLDSMQKEEVHDLRWTWIRDIHLWPAIADKE